MKELTELTSFLKKGEITLLNNYYNAESRGKDNKRLSLFNLVYKKQVKNDLEAAKILYNGKPNSAYGHLKARLKADIHNIILLQDAETKTATPYGQAMFSCRRQLIVGDILLARGAYISGENLLKTATATATKFELIAEQIILKDILRTYIGFKKGVKEYKKYTQDIDKLLPLLKDTLRAKDYSINLGLGNMFQKNKGHEYIESTKIALEELYLILSRTKSAHIAYLYYKISLFYYQIIHNFNAALEAAKKFLEVIEKEKAIFSLSRKADAHLQLSVIYLNLRDHRSSISSAENAVKLFDSKKVNYLLGQEMVFMSSVNAEIKKAEMAVKAAFRHPQIKSNTFLLAKWTYYKANISFFNKDFDKVMDILNKNNELMKDSSGWLLGYKLLELFSLVELNDYDLASYRLKAFGQLLYRQKLNNILRYKTIFQVIVELHNNYFDFKKTLGQKTKELNLLEDGRNDFYYDPIGFEIVRFDKWFKYKASL